MFHLSLAKATALCSLALQCCIPVQCCIPWSHVSRARVLRRAHGRPRPRCRHSSSPSAAWRPRPVSVDAALHRNAALHRTMQSCIPSSARRSIARDLEMHLSTRRSLRSRVVKSAASRCPRRWPMWNAAVQREACLCLWSRCCAAIPRRKFVRDVIPDGGRWLRRSPHSKSRSRALAQPQPPRGWRAPYPQLVGAKRSAGVN